MPIKLIQVQRKLNVGINTVVEFLRKKGFEVEDNNPNTRIGDEQYALLVKEFGKDLPNGGRERERVVPERPHREASSVKEEKSSEIKTVIPEEFRPKIVTKGRIDLDRPHKKVQEVQHQPVSVPVEKKVEKPVEAATAAKTADAPVEEVKTPEVKAPEVEIPEVKIPEMKQQPEEIKEEKVIVVEKEAAEVMKLTAENLKAQGIVERVFAEPEEYIVQNMDVVIMQMDEAIEEFLMKYKSLSEQELIEHRYERFRNM